MLSVDKKRPFGDQAERRCSCGRLLFRGILLTGIIEIKCPRCGQWVYVQEFTNFVIKPSGYLVLTDMKGVVMSCTPGVANLLGYAEHELTGKNLTYFTPLQTEEAIAGLLRQIQAISTSPTPYLTGAARQQTRNGELIDGNFFGKYFELQNRPFVFWFFESQRGALQNRQATYLLTSEPEQSGGGVSGWDLLVDKNGMIVETSAGRDWRWLTQDPDRLKGRLLFSMLDSPPDKERLAAQLQSGKNFLVQCMSQADPLASVELLFIPDFDDAGLTRYIVSIVRNK